MSRRRSQVPLLVACGLLALLGAGAWLLFHDERGAPTDQRPAPVAPQPDRDVPPPELPPPVEQVAAPAPEPPPPAAGTLVGRLVDVHRVPVGQARVALHRGPPGPLAGGRHLPALGLEAQVAADGSFRIDAVPASTELVLRALDGPFAPTDSGPHAVWPGQVTDLGTLVLDAGLTVSGVVLDEASRPVPGAQVDLGLGEVPTWGEADPTPLQTTRCDDDGRFVLAHARRPPFVLVAQAAGLARGGATVEASFDPQRTVIEVTLTLRPARDLRGRVVAAADGTPVAGAEVLVAGGTLFSRTTSDASGRFLVADLPADIYQVSTDPPGFCAGHAVTTLEAFDAELVLELAPTGALEGRVVDAREQPIPAFDLQVRTSTRRGSIGEVASPVRRTRDPAGRFRADDLEPGFYLLEVWAPGHAVTLSDPVRLLPGADARGITVAMQVAAGLVGSVVNDLGEPVPGATVSLHVNDTPTTPFLRESASSGSWHQRTRTDAEGRFALREVTAGEYQVMVDHAAHPLHYRNDVSVTEGEVTELAPIVLPRPATLTGTVVDAAGQVMVGATVYLGGGQNRSTSLQASSDGQGRYRFERLDPGEYTVRVFSITANPLAHIATEVRRIERDDEGQPVLRPDIVLAPGQVLEHLVRADG